MDLTSPPTKRQIPWIIIAYIAGALLLVGATIQYDRVVDDFVEKTQDCPCVLNNTSLQFCHNLSDPSPECDHFHTCILSKMLSQEVHP